MAQQLTPAKACDWLAALDQRQAHLEERLRDALASSSPDPERVSWIESEKLRIKDTINSLALYLREGPFNASAPLHAAGVTRSTRDRTQAPSRPSDPPEANQLS
jgi:hypothetical protein